MQNLKDDNVWSKVSLLLLTVPEHITTLEKIRWLYIKAGELFSYDFRVMENKNVTLKKVDYDAKFISRYQTCVQITNIFNDMLKIIYPECTSIVIERNYDGKQVRGEGHVANLVTLQDGTKYVLDLTLDLYLIQAGCQTSNFGFSGDIKYDTDIIPLCDCREMDLKLNLIRNGDYTDKKIIDLDEYFLNFDYTDMSIEEIINFKIEKISAACIPNFFGIHEGQRFVNKLFLDLLKYPYRDFNLFSRKSNDIQMYTVFAFNVNDIMLWYIYSTDIGLIKVNTETINLLLMQGWTTNSKTLKSYLNDSFNKESLPPKR